MKLVIPLLLLLPSCAQDIAGLSLKQRLELYSIAATATGHPEAATIIYGVKRAVTAPKQPLEVEP